VAGRGTTCWKVCSGADGSILVVKDSWQFPEWLDEGELLKAATEKNVINVTRYYHHETVCIDGKLDDINGHVRKRLNFTKATYALPSNNTAPEDVKLPAIMSRLSAGTSGHASSRQTSVHGKQSPQRKAQCLFLVIRPRAVEMKDH